MHHSRICISVLFHAPYLIENLKLLEQMEGLSLGALRATLGLQNDVLDALWGHMGLQNEALGALGAPCGRPWGSKMMP